MCGAKWVECGDDCGTSAVYCHIATAGRHSQTRSVHSESSFDILPAVSLSLSLGWNSYS